VIIYGRNPVREALRGRRGVQRIWVTESLRAEPWVQAARVPRSRAVAEQLEALCGSAAHQGVCAEVDPFPYTVADQLLALPEPMIVALDQIQDPQNLGSICRTAECAGVAGVVIPDRRAAEITAAVCKASAGAVEHLPVAKVRNVADFLIQAKQAGAWCYGAAADGAVGYDAVDYSGALVLVLGSEGKGLRPRVAAACDALVSLPLKGRIGSLNVSAAAAALLYAATRSRA
jgi:23S rRNA (guanosine2251-2'-O)-methyltransferase